MSKKIYLNLLILCGILCQGIIATLLNEDTKESSNFLIRNKRVINHFPGGITPTAIEEAGYIVSIKRDHIAHCAGAILSHYTVITAAPCVLLDVSHYLVYSAARYEHRGKNHTVHSKDLYYGNSPQNQHEDGIALITVDPPFVYNLRTRSINLYLGPLAVGTQATVRGWGCSYPPQRGPTSQRALRTIIVPLISRAECQNDYQGSFVIMAKHICTYHEQQYCARTDMGTPLVVNNQLAGIHIWKGEHRGRRNPDVFIDLQRNEYRQWIEHKALLI